MIPDKCRFVFFGSSRFSTFVLDELEKAGYSPILNITSAKAPLPELPEADLFVVASFGKIIPKSVLDLPKQGCLNVHPSLLPMLRGPAPIQGTILGLGEPAVTIIKMDEQMDHGPILAQEKVSIDPWPDHYATVEEKLARAGGQLLISVLKNLLGSLASKREQDHTKATYIKLVKKEDGLLDFPPKQAGPPIRMAESDDAEKNYRKVLAYSTWPGAYLFFKKKTGQEVRVVVKDATIEDGKFVPVRVIPAGKKEMGWTDFLRGNA